MGFQKCDLLNFPLPPQHDFLVNVKFVYDPNMTSMYEVLVSRNYLGLKKLTIE